MVLNKEFWVEHKGLWVSSEGRIRKINRFRENEKEIIYTEGLSVLRKTFVSEALLGESPGRYCKLVFLDGNERNLSLSNMVFKNGENEL